MEKLIVIIILFSQISNAKTAKEVISFEKDCITKVKSTSINVNCDLVKKEWTAYYSQVIKIHKDYPFCRSLAISPFGFKKVALVEYKVSKCIGIK